MGRFGRKGGVETGVHRLAMNPNSYSTNGDESSNIPRGQILVFGRDEVDNNHIA
jgi:hypothetical protein